MLKRSAVLYLFAAALLAPLEASVPSNLYVLAPPSVDDIVRAMGPDAQGLQIRSENIPDIFTLTSGRIDEDAKKFIVEQPYISGRWMGGKAVIEYARDLSYTLISVYDKKGKRQRIYSVVIRPKTKQAAQKLADSKEAAVPEQAFPVTDIADIPEPDEYEAAPLDLEPEKKPVKSPSKRSASSGKAAPSTGQPPNTAGGFEWDDDAGAYVPKSRGKSTKVASVPVTPEPAVELEPPKKKRQAEPPPPPPSMEVAKRPPPSSRSSYYESVPAAPRQTPVPPEVRHELIEAEVPSTEELLTAEPAASYEKPASSKSKPKSKTKAAAASAPPPSPPPPPPSSPPPPAVSAKKTEMVWDDNAGEYVPKAKPQSSSTPAPKESAASTSWVPEDEPPAPKKSAVSREADRIMAALEPPAPKKKSVSKEADRILAAYEDQEPPSKKRKRQRQVEELTAKPASTPTKYEEPAPTPEPEPELEPVSEPEPPVTSRKAKASPEKDDYSEVGTGPETNGADTWVPKAVPVRKPGADVDDPALKAAMQVASVPKPAPGPANPSLDQLLKMAAESKSTVPDAGDTWVAKSGPSEPRRTEADINAELTRVRQIERQQKAAAAAGAPQLPPVRQDVNNPEEGVLPIHAFEKYAGPKFGRHREYERRVYWGKRSKAPIKEYDFYVDEVDRKKEYQIIYYYQKGKVPKLVAQERFNDVKFLSNYDVDPAKLGKPKLTTY